MKHFARAISNGFRVRCSSLRQPNGISFRANRGYASPAYPGHMTRASDHEMSLGSWMLLAVPAASFGLGVWQVQRKEWKENLIASMSARLKAEPILLPNDVADVRTLSYQRVFVTGVFEHENEVLLTPRTKMREAFDGNASDPGSQVITPFIRKDTGERILVNRGWIPDEYKDPASRQEGQLEGDITLTAIVHNPASGKPNTFVPDNNPELNRWHWLDLPELAKKLDTCEVIVEVTAESTPKSGYPYGGQTQINIRNEHMQYIFTWFTLSGATLAMWFVRFRRALFKR
eukprot:m.106770 g.106770  ORF g.106770 m.106770 type:complete len:288 (-) comp13901_c0_seq3:258-1121(-)